MHDYNLYGHAPRMVWQPGSADELAALLRQATADGVAVVPWGAGTQQHLGRPPARYDAALCLKHLNRIVEYTPADLVLTVEAGAQLGVVQAELARHGQWLPWDPPGAATATIGGLLATAAAGPLRLGYGAPRDWTLGLQVALGDGRLVTSGARVVKNVAGYDAHKLHLGALGTLGVIVTASFKLAPLPAFRRTLLVAFTEPRATINAMEGICTAPLNPISLVALNSTAGRLLPPLGRFLTGQPERLLLIAARFAGTPDGVQRQIREATQHCIDAGATCIELDEADDTPLWQAIADFARGGPLNDAAVTGESLLLRMGIRPAHSVELLRALERTTNQRGWEAARLAYARIGLVYARWWLPPGTPSGALVAALNELRQALGPIGGYVVVEDASPALRPALDIWGPPPPTLELMRSLKAQWDPAGILNAGRYLL